MVGGHWQKPTVAVMILGLGLGLNLNPVNGLGIMTRLGAIPQASEPEKDNQPFQLQLGQALQFNAISLQFVQILQDSRCPLGAQCIWPGDAVIQIAIQEPGQSPKQLNLSLSQSLQFLSSGGTYQIKLLQLTPYPGSQSAQIPVARLTVKRS